MKLHQNLIAVINQILQDIFIGGRYADKVIQYVIKKNSKLGARDRRFIAETAYDIVRYWRLLSAAVDQENIAIKESFAKVIDLYLLTSGYKNETNLFNQSIVLKKFNDLQKIRKYRESIPDWLDDFGQGELGDIWERELSYLNKPAEVFLRTNTLKINRKELLSRLRAEEVECDSIENYPDAIRLLNRKNLYQTKSYKSGLFEIQDVSSQLVAPFLDPKPGERIIDACAGGGGKSLHIAALMNNKGKIISLDTDQQKLDNLKERSRRNGVTIIERRFISSNKIIKRLADSADRLLLDVPCSGSGVIRRNPDTKWKLSVEAIKNLIDLQQQILTDYSKMLKSGGMLVYSTCSIFPSENEQQIETFLKNNSQFDFVSSTSILPSTDYDGFYICRLKKK